ncbi:MCE family protein [Mycolicibacterium holsaticum]|uniref:MCE family protein n=2 Tax=Mycolicibacterium holsaticum TaxID=152142 RepID=UPI001C7CC07C|nr:MCE family protein [Mycolicibacterium holsaticum]MDA4106805.1 mammalian cell entry protein [Mycolicibacterium holsaticum DSM 44478 = JCM 12374]QZA14075.1 MCE family protein [Mycolicibacterium holsaticum DSM 44478 = JCM 12374]
MNRRGPAGIIAVSLIGMLIAAGVVVVRQLFYGPKSITAIFSTASGIYPGDDVRVVGIKVGRIESIQPQGQHTKLVMAVDRDVPVPMDAHAIIVAPNLVAARYVQLTPAYEDTGPTMSDGAEIPVDRTAVPVEWGEVKTQLMRLATELGPSGDVSSTSVGRFIDSAATAMGGNGDKLRRTLAELAGVGRILAEGSGDIVSTIKNLQIFVSALRDSGEQIVLFQDRLATLSSLLNDNRSALDAALTDLSDAIADVQRFVAGSRNQTSEQIQRLAGITQNLVDHRLSVENILHVAPNGIANGYNIYNPDTGAVSGAFVINNFSSPVHFICSAISAVENITSPETAKLCAQYLGPALRQLNFNGVPMPINPYLRKSASPENLIYTDPALAPGDGKPDPGPQEMPPVVSAFTGAGDVEPPPGYGLPLAVAPGPAAPDHLPAAPSPALFPGAPVPPSPGLPQMLLPAEGQSR